MATKKKKTKINKHTTAGKRLLGRFRSLSEKRVANELLAKGIKYRYERTKFEYYLDSNLKLDCPNCGLVKGRIRRHYLPDFELPNGLFIEVKGRFTPRDRKKMRAIRTLYPSLPIGIVFDSDRKIEGSKKGLRYGEWANKNGFPWSIREIPPSWLEGAYGNFGTELKHKEIVHVSVGEKYES